MWAQSLLQACERALPNCTANSSIQKIKDIPAVLAAARFWHDKPLTADQVVREHLYDIHKHPTSAGALLTGVSKITSCEEIWKRVQGSIKAVQTMGADIINAEDYAHAGSSDALMEYEGALAYAHQALRGCAGSLTIGEPQLEVLRSYLRDIKPWLRCLLSNFDPVVMERWGKAARDELAVRSDLGSVLRHQGYDILPILKHT
jgi:hypothetical protein